MKPFKELKIWDIFIYRRDRYQKVSDTTARKFGAKYDEAFPPHIMVKEVK